MPEYGSVAESSDIDGVSARSMIEALIEGTITPNQIAELAKGRLRGKKTLLKQAVLGKRSSRHRFLLRGIQSHIQWLEIRLSEIDGKKVAAMQPYQKEWQLLQTIPGIDKRSRAMLLAEIGTNMDCFVRPEHLSSWAGLCPGNHESAGKKKVVVPDVVTAMSNVSRSEIANSARKTNSQFKGLYSGLVIRRGQLLPVMALAHKLLEITYTNTSDRFWGPFARHDNGLVSTRWIKSKSTFGFSCH